MIQITQAEWDAVQAMLVKLTGENLRLTEGITMLAQSCKLTSETIDVLHEGVKATEKRLADRLSALEEFAADALEADAYADGDLDPPRERRKADDGGPAVIPFQPTDKDSATPFDAAMVEAEIEAACDELGMTEADADYVMASHRASDGKLMRTMFAHGCDYRGYVRARIDIREGLREVD